MPPGALFPAKLRIAASTPPARCGIPHAASPISTPLSVPVTIRSWKSPRWPMRNTRSANWPRPLPRGMLLLTRICARRASAEWPSGRRTAVSEAECSGSTAHCVSKPPVPHGSSRRLGCALVAREYVRQPLFPEHFERDFQSLQHVGRGRVGEKAVHVGRDHVFPIPEGSGHPGGLSSSARLFRYRVERQAGRQHQALLRSANRDVHAPFVMPIVDGPQRRDRIHHQKRRMPGGINRPPQRGDV